MIQIIPSSLRSTAVATLAFLAPLSSAFAQSVIWETVRIRGEGRAAICNPSTVLTSYVDNSAAFVFTNLGVNIDPNVPLSPGAEFGACNVRSRIVVPQGYYLSGISQQTIAGVVKSVGARGAVRSKLFLQTREAPNGSADPAFPGLGPLGLVIDRGVQFAPREEMNEPMLVLDGNYVTPRGAAQYMCQYTRVRPVSMDIVFRAAVQGQRTPRGGAIIVNVDSSDVQLNLGASLGRCP